MSVNQSIPLFLKAPGIHLLSPEIMFIRLKQIFSLLFVFAAVALCAAEYNAILLGDIHFDALSYHCTPDGKPQVRINRRYINMWQKKAPAMLSHAAGLITPETAFVIQAGDFTQGDAISLEQQEKMLADAFIKVKSFFPEHRLLPVKGNHDVRGYLPQVGKNGKTIYKRRNSGDPADKAFLPLVARELGKKKITGNYYVVHDNDLYIFYDCMVKDSASLKFLQRTLKSHPNARHVFFITHLPVLACSPGVPGWLVPGADKIAGVLFERNAIIITAHTHCPTLIKVRKGKNTLTQLVVSSMAYHWGRGKAAGIKAADFAGYLKLLAPEKLQNKKNADAIEKLQMLQIDLFEMYSNAAGITVLKVNRDKVSVEIHADASGKPVLVKRLK